MPGYATADFSVGAEHDNLTVELFVKNAFDSARPGQPLHALHDLDLRAGLPWLRPAAVYVVPIQPLTVGMKVAQKF